jgi:hypothetical protein
MAFENIGKWIGGLIIAVIVGSGLLWGGGAIDSLRSSLVEKYQQGAEQFKQEEEKRKKEQEQEERTAISNIENVQKIESQKIKVVSEKEIELENGVKLPVADSTKNTCRVGDVIMNYDEEKNSLICEGIDTTTRQTYRSSFFYPSPFSTGNIISGAVGYFWGRSISSDNYFKSRQYINSNGYTYDSSSKTYTHASGNKYTVGNGNISKTSSKSSKTSGNGSSTRGSNGGSSTTGGSSGHGGGAGSSSGGSGSS